MYNYRVFKNTCELGALLYSLSFNKEEKDTVLIANYEVTSEVLKHLLSFEDADCVSVELVPSWWDGYDKEYILTITDEHEVYVEPFIRDGRALIVDDDNADVIFVHGDVCTATVENIDFKKILPFSFKWED